MTVHRTVAEPSPEPVDPDVEAVMRAWNLGFEVHRTSHPGEDFYAHQEAAARVVLDVLRQERGWQKPGVGE